ncbi:ribosome maturation factor RimP [Pseudonocardia sp. N23]|uniref:ribosome maturation factor RimP n=1 Tax=Pseudonocardia sp. N23 TaxID=1987376 RepID=UPI000BFCC4FC|nr:ribosome maturation factor RimP [Pseudonocardia sp. N23]GAY09420.1 clustered with transcription termination protein NusA [Pseudonocardia sp. N23]
MPTPDQVGRQLHELLAPIVADAGFELDELDVRATGRRHTVKVVVDSADDTAGVSLDVIATLSRAASAELDQHEHLIGGSYTLEVTSPGVDRPLTLPRHWRRAFLRLVEVTPVDGDKLTGRVGRAGDDAVDLLVDGEIRALRYTDVEKALVQVEFKQPPDAEVEKLGGRVERTEDEV